LHWTLIRTILEGLVLFLLWGLAFWHIFRAYRGDKFIETASLTAVFAVVVIACSRIPGFSDWVLVSMMILLGVMTFASVFFGLQQVLRFLLRRKSEHRDPDSSE
jgi:hypothetical protein